MHTTEQQLLLACLPLSPEHKHLAFLLEQQPDWQQLHSLGLGHGVLPLIYQSVKAYPDALLPTSIKKQLQHWFAAHALRNLQMQKELQRLVKLLTEQQISVVPFKGPILATEVYGDIALRSFADLDLLVPPEQAQAAAQILLTQGYQTDFNLPQQRWASLQRTDNHLPLYHPQHDWAVEIHWQLFHPLYALPFELTAHWSALQNGDNLEGGREGRLESVETLVMLCAHGTKHFWEQLKWLVDIDRLLSNGFSGASRQTSVAMPKPLWQKTLSLASSCGSLRSLLLGLNLSQMLLGTPLDDEIAENIAADKVIGSLSEVVVANLFPEDSGEKRYIREYSFYLQSRDNFGSRLSQIVRWLFWPRRADWEVFRLGDRCHGLFYLQRPLRMLGKYMRRMVTFK